MRLFVAGANGSTGRLVVREALDAGHEVTAFVRRTDGLPTGEPGLTTVLGDVVHDVRAATAALRGSDAVIATLGNGLLARSGRRPKIMGAAFRTISSAMTAAGVRRVVTVLSYGSAATAAGAPLGIRLLRATLLRADFADLAAADAAVTGADLDWTICHFGRLTDGPPTGRSTVSTSLARPARYAVPRADLAALLVELAADGSSSRRRLVVSGPVDRR